MKISYNWLKEYLDIDLSAEEVSHLLTNIGLEVEGIESYESVTGGLENVVIGEIIACEKHPDADKLKITKVDIGQGEALQIVCGAPNCRVGLKSPIALVGATLYPFEKKESFQIKKAKIRGVESFGMICAEDELGLSAEHAGILELPTETKVGTNAADFFGIEKDIVFEIGLTPNRSDAQSHIGVARDLSAALFAVKNVDKNVLKPSNKIEFPKEVGYNVFIEDKGRCKRYSCVVIKNIQIDQSPNWLQNRLKAIGLKPINNLVDITNFVLHEYGQPLHAFDADKINGKELFITTKVGGTLFKTLDGKEIKLSHEDLVIADKSQALCLAGVYGGFDSGVTSETKNVLLESAFFSPSSIRKTASRHQLKTDAASHFEKGCDINITVEALKRASNLILEICGGELDSNITDVYELPSQGVMLQVSLNRINRLIGLNLSKDLIASILRKLEIEVEDGKDDILQLIIPTFKTDVKREADIAEEVLRVYGFNKVEMPLKLNASLSFSDSTNNMQIENAVADMLSGDGLHEISTDSISKSIWETNEEQKKLQIKLINSTTAELDCMRTSMLYAALDVVAFNTNRKQTNLALYEFGKTYTKLAESFHQVKHLTLLLSGNQNDKNWLQQNVIAYDFYSLKRLVQKVLHRFGIHHFSKTVSESNDVFSYYYEYKLNEKSIVRFGMVNEEICLSHDVKNTLWFADFIWDNLIEISQSNKIRYTEAPKYPAVKRDLAIIIDENVSYDQLKTIAFKTIKTLTEVELFDVYKGDKIENGKKSYAISLTLLDKEKTLSDSDIDKSILKLIQNLESSLSAKIRK